MPKLKIICKGTNQTEDIDHGDRIIIDIRKSLEHSDNIGTKNIPLQNNTMKYVNIVFPDVNKDNWFQQGIGVHHLVGRVDLSLKIGDFNKYVWRHPEDSISPVNQVKIAKLICVLFKKETP